MRLVLCLALLCCPAFGAITFTAQCSSLNVAGITNPHCTTGSITAGSTVLALLSAGTNVACTSVSDGTNTFTQSTHSPSTFVSGSGKTCAFYFANETSGAKTITGTTASGTWDIWVLEIKGAATSTPLDVDNVGTGASSKAINTPSMTTTVNGDGVACAAAVGGTVTAAGGSFTLGTVSGSGDADEFQVQSTAGSIAAALTQNANSGWSSICVAFKASGGGPTCTPTMALMGVGQCG